MNGKKCNLYGIGEPKTLIWWGIGQEEKSVSEVVAKLGEKYTDFALITFESENWDNEYSPWEYSNFSGKGIETLNWIEETKHLFDLNYPDITKHILGGYSLAGLFTLWAGIEKPIFDGLVSCSGSLWYPGWIDYLIKSQPKSEISIYLSLGRKEGNTASPEMKSVMENTEKTKEILVSKGVQNSVLNWCDGGHFTQVNERMVRGFSWILSQIQ